VLTGNLGRPGTGASPIRGQNNVQGACDVGALPNVFSDYRPLNDPAARADHLRLWGVEPPTTAGLRIPEMFDAVHDGHLKAMYILAEDVAQSDPHTQHVVGALEKLEFLVVQEIFLSETAKYAHVVLPGAAFLEKEGTFVNSDRRIQPDQKGGRAAGRGAGGCGDHPCHRDADGSGPGLRRRLWERFATATLRAWRKHRSRGCKPLPQAGSGG
jgi:predicted molibdopterin-dependent oxidoreductase YjgC